MIKIGKRLEKAEKILQEIRQNSAIQLPVKEDGLLASTLILLCKLELAVLQREYKEDMADKQYVPESQVPDIMMDVRGTSDE